MRRHEPPFNGKRFLLNQNTGEIHDLDNETYSCHIDKIEKEGKNIIIGFNPKFFVDALRAIDEEEVTLYMVNPKAPCFIKDYEGSYIYLILPVNFSTSTN